MIKKIPIVVKGTIGTGLGAVAKLKKPFTVTMTGVKKQINKSNYSKLKKGVVSSSALALGIINVTRKSIATVLYPERMDLVENYFTKNRIIEKKLDDMLKMMTQFDIQKD